MQVFDPGEDGIDVGAELAVLASKHNEVVIRIVRGIELVLEPVKIIEVILFSESESLAKTVNRGAKLVVLVVQRLSTFDERPTLVNLIQGVLQLGAQKAVFDPSGGDVVMALLELLAE